MAMPVPALNAESLAITDTVPPGLPAELTSFVAPGAPGSEMVPPACTVTPDPAAPVL